MVNKAAHQFLNEQVNDRLKNALGGPDSYVSVSSGRCRVVRAIVCSEVSVARIVARDTKSYFGVLLDDNNRKPIARLWFNDSVSWMRVSATRCESCGVVEDLAQRAREGFRLAGVAGLAAEEAAVVAREHARLLTQQFGGGQ